MRPIVNEKKILLEVSQIARRSTSPSNAIQELSDLLERALGGKVLLVSVPDESSSDDRAIAHQAERFFDEAVDLPYRSLYTVSLRESGRELGILVALFALGSFHEGIAQRLANFIGEQLGMLLERIRLTRERRQLLRQFLAMKDALATRIDI